MRRGASITAGLILGAVAIGLTQAPPPPQLATPQEQAAATVQMQPTPPPEMASRVRFVGNASFTDAELRALLDALLAAGVPVRNRTSGRLARWVKGELSIDLLKVDGRGAKLVPLAAAADVALK